MKSRETYEQRRLYDLEQAMLRIAHECDEVSADEAEWDKGSSRAWRAVAAIARSAYYDAGKRKPAQARREA